MSASTFDAVVIGAGIVGAACARELALAGLRVAILEASDQVGGGATSAGMGHLAVMDDSPAQFALTNFSQQLWHAFEGELPKEAEYVGCGSLWVAADEEEFAEVERKYRFYTERGLAVEVLDERQLAQAEPNLRRGMAGALLMTGDSVCYAPCATAFFVEQVCMRGGELFLEQPVVEIRASSVETKRGDHLSAGVMILATGVDAPKLVRGIEIAPRKGQLVITDRYPEFLRHQVIELGYLKSAHSRKADSVAFNVQPRATGQILIGSSRQYGTEDPVIEQQMLSRMLRRAIEYMPALEHHSAVRTWTGFRAATPDKLPLIGACPGYERLYLATGHEGLGISTSLATARLLADDILGRSSAIAREPYLPVRSFAAHG